MICSLRGTILSKSESRVVIEVGGVGYEVHVASSCARNLPPVGGEALLHVEESVSLYGGLTTLYGFSGAAERAMFVLMKDSVPSTGAKKALEYLDKASRSLPDFRRAILEKDMALLTEVFGFTKKTAEKLVDSLKEKFPGLPVSGPERFVSAGMRDASPAAMSQAMSALASLGYRSAEARTAVQAVADETEGARLEADEIVRKALKRLSP